MLQSVSIQIIMCRNSLCHLLVQTCVVKVIMVWRVVVEAGVFLLFHGDNVDGLVWHIKVVLLEPCDDTVYMGAMILTDSIWHPLIHSEEDHILVFCRETEAWDNASAVISISLMWGDTTPPPCIAAHCSLFDEMAWLKGRGRGGRWAEDYLLCWVGGERCCRNYYLWGTMTFYDVCAQSWCWILALDTIIETFYDFEGICLWMEILLAFTHVHFFQGWAKIIEFFYDDEQEWWHHIWYW